jgi:methylenetetrahydrofolate reductase (NADH)
MSKCASHIQYTECDCMSKTARDAGIAGMLRGYSLELVPGDSKLIDAAADRLDPRTLVSLTWIPGSNPMHIIAPAARLRRAGLLVMPHIGARHLESKSQLERVAELLVGEAGVDRILIVGGDRAEPAGPYDSSLAVMQTGVFQRVGITRIAVAGFPEGNPHIPTKVLDDALLAKVDFARSDGLELSIVTQFCFAAAPIVTWIRHLRAEGVHCPVRIGLAGPAGAVTLARYALKCGVGNSMRVLRDNPTFTKALVDRGPESIMRDIASSFADEDSAGIGIAGLHFYTFGGFSKTLNWIGAVRSSRPAADYS